MHAECVRPSESVRACNVGPLGVNRPRMLRKRATACVRLWVSAPTHVRGCTGSVAARAVRPTAQCICTTSEAGKCAKKHMSPQMITAATSSAVAARASSYPPRAMLCLPLVCGTGQRKSDGGTASVALGSLWKSFVAFMTCVGLTVALCDDDHHSRSRGAEGGDGDSGSGSVKTAPKNATTARGLLRSMLLPWADSDGRSRRGGDDDVDVGVGVGQRDPVNLTDAAASLIVDARDLMREGDLAAAEAMYREALEHVALIDRGSDAVIVLLTRVANLCYAQHKWAPAADAFAAAVRGLVHAAGKAPDDLAVVEMSLKIAGAQQENSHHF